MTKFTGFKSDGTSLSDKELEDGAGINIQLTNGEIDKVRHFTLTSLVFHVED